jgi:hypothetical protein
VQQACAGLGLPALLPIPAQPYVQKRLPWKAPAQGRRSGLAPAMPLQIVGRSVTAQLALPAQVVQLVLPAVSRRLLRAGLSSSSRMMMMKMHSTRTTASPSPRFVRMAPTGLAFQPASRQLMPVGVMAAARWRALFDLRIASCRLVPL